MNKVAKNMDSVFADSKEELDLFDILFDDDDTIIDTVNGIDKNGVPVTGPDPEDLFKSQGKENNDPIQDKNDAEQRDGKAKESDKEVEGEDQESIQAATESKVELDAGKFSGLTLDVKALENDAKIKLGLNEAQADDPLDEDDPEERAGVEVPVATVSTEAEELDKDDKVEKLEDEIDKDAKIVKEEDEPTDEEISSVEDSDDDEDAELDDLIGECDDPISDKDDADQREGKEKADDKNVEGEDQELIDNVSEADILDLAIGEAEEEPIEDLPDKAQRSGEAIPDSTDVEGEDQEPIDAANECGDGTCADCSDSSGDLDKDIDEYLAADTVPDDVKLNEDGDPIDDLCDAGQRDGAVKPDDKNVEGEDQELIDNVSESDALEKAAAKTDDPIADADDADQREGKEKADDKEVEGEDQESIQAATEDTDIDSLLKEEGEVEVAGDEIDDEAIETIEDDDKVKNADIDLEYEDIEDDELLNIAMGEED